MTGLTAGGASPTTVRRPQPRTPSQTSDDQSIGICDCSAETDNCRATGTIHGLSAFLLTFAGAALFLMVIAAVGLVVELLAGIGGLWIVAGVFLVIVCAAARSEGVL